MIQRYFRKMVIPNIRGMMKIKDLMTTLFIIVYLKFFNYVI